MITRHERIKRNLQPRFHLLFLSLLLTALLLHQEIFSAIADQQEPPEEAKSLPKTEAVPQNNGSVLPPRINTEGRVVGDPNNAIDDLKQIYELVNLFRSDHNGTLPSSGTAVLDTALKLPQYRNREGFDNALQVLTNPDSRYADSPFFRKAPDTTVAYVFGNTRRDGSPAGGPKPVGTQDVICSTEIYYHLNNRFSDGVVQDNPSGFYMVLWDNGQIDKIAYDQLLYAPTESGKGLGPAFPGAAGVPSESATYAEYWAALGRGSVPPIGKPVPKDSSVAVRDNGGPESLLTLSRLMMFPSRYGIERETLWEQFDPVQQQFTLADIQAGSVKLNLPLQLQKLTLDQLQQRGTPAIFLTQDDKRIVTLANLDAEQAIVLDQGLTRIVSRDMLQKRYGGEALISGDSAARSRTQVDDPIRVVPFASTDQEVMQTVNISNRGSEPLSLQIERPIPGVTEATLSAETLAPGQSATLSLKIKWRTILKGDTQNVFVFLHTNDPVQPRLQLGFQLKLPAQAQPAKP